MNRSARTAFLAQQSHPLALGYRGRYPAGVLMADEHLCEVCSADRHPLAYCCKPCKKMLDRVDMRAAPDRNARLNAMKSSWDGTCFRCYYTGWKLTLENHADPLYATWEHRTPRDETDIVVCAAIINDMKTDLNDSEFRSLVIALANRFNGCPDDIVVPDLKHYRRNYVPEPDPDRGITNG